MMALDLDVVQGFNDEKTAKPYCGFVTKLQVADKVFNADLEVNKIGEEGKQQVVGIISAIEWSTTSTDPITIEMRVSVTNKQNIMSLNLLEMNKNDVTIQFETFNYDSNTGQAYKEFHCLETDIKGLLQKLGDSKYDLKANPTAASEVKSPENYYARIGFNSVNEAQVIGISTSSTDKGTKGFGKKVTA